MSGDIYTTAELRALGIGSSKLSRAVREGKVFRVMRGVYTTKRPTGRLLLRAVSVGKLQAAFTGRTACELYLKRQRITRPVQAIVPRGLSVPESNELVEFRIGRNVPVQMIDGLRVVSPVRAAMDTSETWLGSETLGYYYKGKHGASRLEEDLAAVGRPNTQLIDALRTAPIGGDSNLERTLFSTLRHRGLKVQQNVLIGGYRYDGLVEGTVLVEVDGYGYHAPFTGGMPDTFGTFVRDRHKSNLAQRMGYLVLRYADSDIDRHIDFCADQIEAAVRESRHKLRDVELLEGERTPVWKWHQGLIEMEKKFADAERLGW